MDRGEIIVTVRRVIAGVSFFFVFLAICTIIIGRRYKVGFTKLIFWLICSCGAQCLGYIIGYQKDGPQCDVVAVWCFFWEWMISLWVCGVAHHTFMEVVYRTQKLAKYFKYYFLLTVSISAFFSLLPYLAGEIYGLSWDWCWITQEHQGWLLSMWFGPFIFLYIYAIVCYLWVFKKLYQYSHHQNQPHIYEMDIENENGSQTLNPTQSSCMMKFLLIFIIWWLFPFLNRLQNALQEIEVFWMVMLHCVFVTSQGFAFSFVYLISDKISLQTLTPAEYKNLLLAFVADIKSSFKTSDKVYKREREMKNKEIIESKLQRKQKRNLDPKSTKAKSGSSSLNDFRKLVSPTTGYENFTNLANSIQQGGSLGNFNFNGGNSKVMAFSPPFRTERKIGKGYWSEDYSKIDDKMEAAILYPELHSESQAILQQDGLSDTSEQRMIQTEELSEKHLETTSNEESDTLEEESEFGDEHYYSQEENDFEDDHLRSVISHSV